ncbi:hypothetical protein ASG59_19470 [Methylobacterium sp. Leaf466]|nr:hypothetical protein ASG59_19470 [Methylobacterium sp. Leaf466]
MFCEDDRDELQRRQNAINKALGVSHLELSNMLLTSRVGEPGNLLATFDRHGAQMTLQPFYHRILKRAQAFRADLIIIDTLADTSGANEIDRAQVNAFVKGCLGGLARGINGSVLALAHPSQQGKASGGGTSGSTAWSNAARGRLYLSALAGDTRQLENMKANYGPKGSKLKIEWRAGAFHLLAATLAGPSEAGASEMPTLEAADDDAVVRAVVACAGVRMTLGKTTPYAAEKVLRQRCPELLKASTPIEVRDALARVVQAGIVHLVEIGRDRSSRAIFGLAVDPAKLSAAAAKSGSDLFA